MKPATIYRWIVLLALVALLEILCRVGVINKLTMQPPHRIVTDLVAILVSGKLNTAILKTFANAASAFLLAMSAGVLIGALLHRRALPPRKSSIRCWRPITPSRSSPSTRCSSFCSAWATRRRS